MKKQSDIIITPCGFKYVYEFSPSQPRKPYKALMFYKYYSKRYKKTKTISIGDRSDGATGAFDIPSSSWWVHDALSESGCWDDGTKLTNWQCSQVISDILKSEGRWVRSRRWKYFTFAIGGGECRKNGMFTLKNEDVE